VHFRHVESDNSQETGFLFEMALKIRENFIGVMFLFPEEFNDHSLLKFHLDE
jgi:hypothetical protein